jgi:hypothetical protein
VGYFKKFAEHFWKHLLRSRNVQTSNGTGYAGKHTPYVPKSKMLSSSPTKASENKEPF